MVIASSANCVVGCCYPLTLAEFKKQLEDPSKDFIRNVVFKKYFTMEENWTRYRKQIVDPYLKLAAHYRQQGFVIIDHFTFEQFKTLIRGQVQHIIIWAHCEFVNTGSIEFSDGLIHPDTFIAVIPIDSNCFLDLSVCRPAQISDRLDVERKWMLVKSVRKPISIWRWLCFYADLFDTLISSQVTYLQAYEILIDKLLRHDNDRNC